MHPRFRALRPFLGYLRPERLSSLSHIGLLLPLHLGLRPVLLFGPVLVLLGLLLLLLLGFLLGLFLGLVLLLFRLPLCLLFGCPLHYLVVPSPRLLVDLHYLDLDRVVHLLEEVGRCYPLPVDA